MKAILVSFLFLFLYSFVQPVFAQQQAPADTVYIPPTDKEKEEKRLANKTANHAALLSAVCPGLGQFYNKKYWKPPIIYVGAAVLTGFIIMNSQEFSSYKQAHAIRIDSDPNTQDEYVGIYTDEQLILQRDYYRRNMQFCFILAAGLYTLNIIDAYVDAHLQEFDVNEDLSLKIRPLLYAVNYSHLAPGLCLSLRLK